MSGETRVERNLHDLLVVIHLLDRQMAPYFEGDVESTDREWLSRLSSIRRVLLSQVNNFIDVYGAPEWSAMDRVGITWGIIETELNKYDIIPTEDRKVFTFKKDASE